MRSNENQDIAACSRPGLKVCRLNSMTAQTVSNVNPNFTKVGALSNSINLFSFHAMSQDVPGGSNTKFSEKQSRIGVDDSDCLY